MIVETSNAENPTPNDYMLRYKHSMGRSRCFVFDNQFEVAKFLHRQNQSVQKTPLSISSAKNHQRWFKAEAKIKKNINLKEKAIKNLPTSPTAHGEAADNVFT